MTVRKTVALLVVMVAAVACSPDAAETPETLRLMAHDSFAGSVNEGTFAPFTEATGIEVETIAAGDAGSMVNQAALSKDNPLADVLFGVDDTFLSRALDEEIFAEHVSPALEVVGDEFVPDTALVTPIDYGDVCINYDKSWFTDAGTPVPSELDQLREPGYAGALTVEHPATSSPGLAFVLATIDEYGEGAWLEFWSDLEAGGVGVVPDWDTAYYSDFTPYGGDSPMVVSYASSPPAEVIFATEPIDEAPTGVVEAGCYRQVEYAGILAGTDYPEAAGQLIDFMLSVEFQETVPLTWFVFPVNETAELPPEFVENTTIPADPARLDPATIADNRDRWIDEWIAVMEG
ncbi:MAG TPA: thiamine ABC transporter substrate-binding protein [Acidimicrobiia bacterium]|nr:thiamine ABC transporter substrate-binding protein [Acidimicrobiia bacterium]